MRFTLILMCSLAWMAGCGGGGGVETVDSNKPPQTDGTAPKDVSKTQDAVATDGAATQDAAAKDASNTTNPPVKKRGTIGVSVLTLDNPFFKVIADNLTAEAAKYGYDTIVVSGDKDPDKQLRQVEGFISQGCKAIVICPCKSKIPSAIEAANKAGIPVFTTDIASEAEGVRVECHIATDNLGGGRLAGKAMIEALGEAGGAVAILHYEDAESCLLRVQGFREVIDKHNAEGKSGKIVVKITLDGKGEQDEGYRAASDAISALDNLRGIFAINDPSAMGAYAALKDAGKEKLVKIIGFDGQREGKQFIKDGKIFADPIQFPAKMGIITAQMIAKYSRGEEIPKEFLIPTELYYQADGIKDPDLK